MNKDEIIDIIDDRLEKRFESYAQAQIALHKEYHDKLITGVQDQIKTTVNGKIDRLTDQITLLNEQIKPVNETKRWFSTTGEGAKAVAGFIAPWAIIGVAVKWFISTLNK